MIEELGHRVVAEAGNIQVGQLWHRRLFLTSRSRHNIAGYSIPPVAEIIGRAGPAVFLVTAMGQQADQKRSEHAGASEAILIAKLGEAINSILSI